MRSLIFAVAAIGAATMSYNVSNPASAAAAPIFTKAPHLESLLGPKAQPVDFFMHKKYHHGCYRPYFCKTKYGQHGHHYKHCYYGECYKHNYHYKPHHYYKHHFYHYKKHH